VAFPKEWPKIIKDSIINARLGQNSQLKNGKVVLTH